MSARGSYSAYIGLLAIVVLATLSFNALALQANKEQHTSLQAASEVKRISENAHYLLDRAAADALYDEAKSEATPGNNCSAATVTGDRIAGYFSNALDEVRKKTGVDCTYSDFLPPSRSGGNPYDFSVSFDFVCQRKIGETAAGQTTATLTFDQGQVNFSKRLEITAVIPPPPPPPNPPLPPTDCKVKVSDNQAGGQTEIQDP